MTLTKREQELNSAKRFETYEDYEAAVLSRARQLRKGSLCVDTILRSFIDKASLDEAARRVVDDTAYWDGE